MRRREFFGLAIVTAAFGLPRPSFSQQSGKLPVIAFLGEQLRQCGLRGQPHSLTV
jgi:hypothetical protein